MKAVSSRGIRWRATDGSVSMVTGWRAAPDHGGTQTVEVFRAPSAESVDRVDGADPRGRRALSVHGDYGSERPCRRAVETIQRLRHSMLVLRRPRHRPQSSRAAGGGSPPHLALGQTVHL